MKEIEVKFKVDDIEAIEAALVSSGVELGETIHQHDTSFAPDYWKPDAPKVGIPFMRVRIEDGKAVLTMKRPEKDQLVRTEMETEVSDGDEMMRIISEIGFTRDQVVIKQRRKGKMGEYEVCVDRIEKLGDFIEIEKLVDDDADGQAVRDEIREVLLDLVGSSEGLEEVHRGYDTLMRLHNEKNKD